MKFVVRWKQDALDDLAAIWLDADSSERRGVTVAAREIDRLLQVDPYGQGESRQGGRRVMFLAPLGASFRVDSQADKVDVLRLWQFF